MDPSDRDCGTWKTEDEKVERWNSQSCLLLHHSDGQTRIAGLLKSEMLAKLEAPPKPDAVWSHSQGLSVSLGGLVGSGSACYCTICNSSF